VSDAPAPVVAVLEDRRDLFGWVLGRRAHHPGVVGVQVGVVDRQSIGGVADAVLAGLGKDPWLSVSVRPTELLAGAWLSTGEVTDALIGYPQLLSDWLLPEVVAWFVGLGVRPWLLFTTFDNEPAITEAAAKVAVSWGVEVVGADVVDEAWPDTATSSTVPASATMSGLPTLPRVDGLKFRSACRDLLSTDDFATVDARLLRLVAEMRTDMAGLAKQNQTRLFERLLWPRVAAASDTEELLLIVRAAQIAGVTHGFHITVDTAVLLGAAEALPRPGLAGPQRWWEHLDIYRDPDPGAAAALYAAGVDPETMPTLTVGDVAENKVRCGDDEIPVTEGARFVEALVMLRRLAGAADGEALFTTHRATSVRPQHIAGLLWGVRTHAGVAVAPTPPSRRLPAAASQLGRYGIRVSKVRDPGSRGRL
jgi:hypothetical protein